MRYWQYLKIKETLKSLFTYSILTHKTRLRQQIKKGRVFIWHKNIKKRKDGRYSRQLIVGKNPDGSKIRKTVYGYTIE